MSDLHAAERERFEAWAKTKGFPHYWHNGEGFMFSDPSWSVWCAALAPAVPQWPMRGARVDGDTVVISVKGGNDAARWLCGELVALIAAAPSAKEPQTCPKN